MLLTATAFGKMHQNMAFGTIAVAKNLGETEQHLLHHLLYRCLCIFRKLFGENGSVKPNKSG
jgi:hypothetical protein